MEKTLSFLYRREKMTKMRHESDIVYHYSYSKAYLRSEAEKAEHKNCDKK